MKIAIVTFPGSTGAQDAAHAFEHLGQEAYTVWHTDETLRKPDAVIISGGYSFGDYLRPGALTRASRVSGAIRRFAQDGGPMLGIGNGFQILCELGVLPGVLLPNAGARFMNQDVHVKVVSTKCPWTKKIPEGKVLTLPVACSAGMYFADSRALKDLEEGNRIALTYTDAHGEELDDRFNGSAMSIAGVMNRQENVLGLMPHPERAVEALFGGEDGRLMLSSIFP